VVDVTTAPTGLTAAEVQERVARGQTNDTGERTSRKLSEIVRANVFTRFNAILGAAAEEFGDAAQQMVWLVEEDEEMHPVLAMAFGDTDEVIVRVPISPGSFLDGRTLAAADLELETGYYLLAIRRAGRYVYRPRGPVELEAGDELIASGPEEGRSRLAELGGYRVLEDDATGEIALVRVDR
jgi:uncharacterized protein with PhoU and TrkA domain